MLWFPAVIVWVIPIGLIVMILICGFMYLAAEIQKRPLLLLVLTLLFVLFSAWIALTVCNLLWLTSEDGQDMLKKMQNESIETQRQKVAA